MLTLHYPRLTSTNEAAKRHAEAGPARWLRVIADTQSAGRGRLGRPWQSPRGGAWFSLVWPNGLSVKAAQPVPLVVGLAVCETISRYFDPEAATALRLKWPNDVLWQGKKLAGVLCEQPWADGHRAGSIVVGVGVNANANPSRHDATMRFEAVSLQGALGHQIDRLGLIDTLSDSIEQRLSALRDEGLDAAMVQTIDSWLAWRGQPVMMQQNKQCAIGQLHGLDAMGRLQLATTIGLQTFDSGELLPLDQASQSKAQP
jgi:BirA family biotin operon repressor/biotin-[acetyl-CoA-carboxylase] ligase